MTGQSRNLAETEGYEIQLLSSNNLDQFKKRSVAVVPLKRQPDAIQKAGSIAAIAAGASTLAEVANTSARVGAGSGVQLAYIKMPMGVDPATCFARVDGFGGQTLTAHNAAGNLVNGSWTPANLPAVSPEMMAMAGMMVMMEAEFAEIKGRLDDLSASVAQVAESLEIRRRSEIEGLYERILDDYVARYDEYAGDEEKLSAARVEIESALTDVAILWAEQVNAMRALGEHLSEGRRSDRDSLWSDIERFKAREQSAATVFELSCVLDRVRMIYDKDVSARRIERERRHEHKWLSKYEDAHSTTLLILTAAVKSYRGAVLALADESKIEKHDKLPANHVDMALRGVADLGKRLASQTPWDAAKEQNDAEVDAMMAQLPQADMSSLSAVVGQRADVDLDRLRQRYDQPAAFVYDGDSLYLIEENE